MRVYAVFVFDQYYPSGGLMDLAGKDLTLDQARTLASRPRYKNDGGWDFWQIVDMASWEVVEIGGVLGDLHRVGLMNSSGLALE